MFRDGMIKLYTGFGRVVTAVSFKGVGYLLGFWVWSVGLGETYLYEGLEGLLRDRIRHCKGSALNGYSRCLLGHQYFGLSAFYLGAM